MKSANVTDTHIEFNGERDSKDGNDYLTISMSTSRTSSPFTVTQTILILNMDRDLQYRVYCQLVKVFG